MDSEACDDRSSDVGFEAEGADEVLAEELFAGVEDDEVV